MTATLGLLEIEPANALAWRQLGNLELELAREDPRRLRAAVDHLLRSQALLHDRSTGLLLVVARLMQDPAYDPGQDLLALFGDAGDNPELLLSAVELALNTGHPVTADALLATAKPALLRQLAAYPATWRLQAAIDRALQRPERARTIEALLGPGG